MSRPVPDEVMTWGDRYSQARAYLYWLTEAEILRCQRRHVARCSACTSSPNYAIVEGERVPVERSCVAGMALHDELKLYEWSSRRDAGELV